MIAAVVLAAAALAAPDMAVSRAAGPQSEVSVAADPRNPQILVAASNNLAARTLRAYGSTDGGATWTSDDAPPLPAGSTADLSSDPVAAIDLRGRQYLGFLAIRQEPDFIQNVGVYVARRDGPAAPWVTPARPVSPPGLRESDDKPALAADVSPASPRRGRLYVAWTRISGRGDVILLAHSDDGGRRWSRPVQVSDEGDDGFWTSLAVGRNGRVYVAWDTGTAILIDSSRDGGAHFGADRRVAPLFGPPSTRCFHGGTSIPAQPRRCTKANPTLVVDDPRGSVYVSYSDRAENGSRDVFLTTLDRSLRPVGTQRVGLPDGRRATDQFLPAAALDPADGRLWVCYYATGAGPARTRATFTCTASPDGGASWAAPAAAASAPSDETRPGTDENEYGDYEGLAVAGGVAHPLWTDSHGPGEEIYAASLS